MYYIKSSDETKIAVEDINPYSKETIVMVHGWPISKEMFEYQKNVLNDYNYRIVSFDIRGFGDSEVSSDGYCYDQLAIDLKYVIDSLNVNEVNLLGFSMGGAIVSRYMNMFDNHKVKKLILAGAAAPSFSRTKNNPYGGTIESTNKLINQTYNDRAQMIEEFGSKVFALKHSKAFIDWFHNICMKGSGIGTIKTAISLRDEDVFYDLKYIKAPTLILHGKLDQICPFGFATIMKEQIPNSKLIPFKYSGHGLFYDELGKFNRELIQFLKS